MKRTMVFRSVAGGLGVGDAPSAGSRFCGEDRRHELKLTTTLSLRDDLRWTIFYTYNHARSTEGEPQLRHPLPTGLEYRLSGGQR